MHKYKNLFFSVFLFFAACKSDKTPPGVIEPEQMTSLLTQLHIVDGSLYNVTQIPDSLYKYGTAKYLDVFKKFHTDSVQFKNSYKYYTSHPELLETIYEQITINLKVKGDSLNKLNLVQMAKDNKRRTDSIKKANPAAFKKLKDEPKVDPETHRVSY